MYVCVCVCENHRPCTFKKRETGKVEKIICVILEIILHQGTDNHIRYHSLEITSEVFLYACMHGVTYYVNPCGKTHHTCGWDHFLDRRSWVTYARKRNWAAVLCDLFASLLRMRCTATFQPLWLWLPTPYHDVLCLELARIHSCTPVAFVWIFYSTSSKRN